MAVTGWIGLGHMGSPMAGRLLQAGHRVCAYNRSPDKTAALAAAGAEILGTPREVVEKAETVFLMLSDAAAVGEVLAGNDGLLAAPVESRIIVNMSTIAPEETALFARQVEERGWQYVEAPVSGSVGAAASGQLVILAGGDAAAVDLCRPYFDILGKGTVHFGAVGTGSAAKLGVNLLLGVMGQGIGEAVLFARQAGVDTERFLELISLSALNSPFFQLKKEMYVTNEFPAAFMVSLMAKDLGLVQAEANKLGRLFPLAGAAADTYRSARDHGFATQDMTAVYRELQSERYGVKKGE